MFVIPFGFFGQAGFDDDAQAFIDAVEGGGDTLSSSEQNAINDLVVGLKSNNLWELMVAFYPYVGGTSSSTKWNLKDPRDLDAAGRIEWYGTVTHTGGVQGGGSGADYGWTNLNPSVYCGSNTNHNFGGFGLTSNTSNGSMMGVESPGTNYAFYDYFNGNYLLNLGQGYKSGTNVGTTGLFIAGAFSDTHKVYRNGSTQVLSSSTTPDTLPNQIWAVLANNVNKSEGATDLADPSDRKYSFHFFYDGAMSSADMDNFYTLATSFNSTLGR